MIESKKGKIFPFFCVILVRCFEYLQLQYYVLISEYPTFIYIFFEIFLKNYEMLDLIEVKIKKILIEKGISLKELIAKIDMTDTGYSKAFSNNSLKIITLLKISDVLEVPPMIFFEKDEFISKPTNFLQGKEVKQQNGSLNIMLDGREKEIEYLKAMIENKDQVIAGKDATIESKDEMILMLKEQIDRMRKDTKRVPEALNP